MDNVKIMSVEIFGIFAMYISRHYRVFFYLVCVSALPVHCLDY